MKRDIYPDGAFEESAGKPYRPSNGTEGDFFIDAWCVNCYRFDEEDGPFNCPIYERMMCHQIGEEGYPQELVWGETGQPLCQAFIHHLEVPEIVESYRCEFTPDLFQEVVQDV
ncbi:hypothetical protein [uncultured Kiloniella sp.]|uniref:hypothetical protein n=1 Tax=uncultured Kiloniella sp. TaxID=1133091 RepID=UPI0026081983|nr:hypothetical protein [uncultured Kiloniella sp.]